MLGVQLGFKCLNEALFSKLNLTPYQVRFRGRKLESKKKHEWIMPRFFKRPLPQAGVPAKVYPLEPAQEEQPYRLDRWTDWRMKKDYLRRQCVVKHGRHRMMLETIHKNNILPVEIRELAEREVQDTLPRDSEKTRLIARCSISSRPRATVEAWRVGRMIFRQLADYNKLSGVQRAIW